MVRLRMRLRRLVKWWFWERRLTVAQQRTLHRLDGVLVAFKSGSVPMDRAVAERAMALAKAMHRGLDRMDRLDNRGGWLRI